MTPLSQLIDELESSGRGVIMTMGKGGVGKTTLAAAIAAELAHRGHHVHLSTTDPAAHVHDAVGEGIAGLSVSRIDPAEQTRVYSEQVMAAAGADLDEQGRALLEEDLRSPCTEEIAVFRAFADIVAAGEDGFVVLDTAPTGHSLLLLDATQSYHRDIARGLSEVPDAVAHLLPRLRDPDYTRVLIVTLPEATPVARGSATERGPRTRRNFPVRVDRQPEPRGRRRDAPHARRPRARRASLPRRGRGTHRAPGARRVAAVHARRRSGTDERWSPHERAHAPCRAGLPAERPRPPGARDARRRGGAGLAGGRSPAPPATSASRRHPRSCCRRC